MTGNEDPVYLDEHHQAIAEFAAAYLDEEERESFVDNLLERRGYQRISTWAAPETDPAGGGPGGRPALLRGQGGPQPRRAGGRARGGGAGQGGSGGQPRYFGGR